MDISIVSGTYNRIDHLKRMVRSVRQSFVNVYGLEYEIVLVDGGSHDGTQDWCKSQPDIKLIEHGDLFGAVKAFNDGAYAASGKYVIMANDDIEFVEDSILVAYVYMETHPDCGGGCFYQDRGRTDKEWTDPHRWFVDYMPATTKQKQRVHVPYAQVGIFHKWIGDAVGWWCNDDDFAKYLTTDDFREIGDGRVGLHTYGGDNQLSAMILELGFEVSPIPNARITDKEADDNLRQINNISGAKDPKSVRGHHPDSWKWGRYHYRKNAREGYQNFDGPIIGLWVTPERGRIANPMPISFKERVLYLPLFEQGWEVQKEQKRGLRDALSRVAMVVEYDYMRRLAAVGKAKMMDEIYELCKKLEPTILLAQLHNGDVINPGDVKNIRNYCYPETRFVNWNGDYWPKQLLSDEGVALARSFDLMTVVNREVVEKHQAQGVNTHYWQIGWEPEGRGYEAAVDYDIVFLASGYSPKRQQLGVFLDGLPYRVGIYGNGWPAGVSKGETLYNFREGCKIYRGARLAIGDSQWPDSGFVSNRIFQILAAGNCVLLHQWFRDYEKLGLIDGVNCLIWQDFPDLRQKIDYWLVESHREKLVEIARRGESLAK